MQNKKYKTATRYQYSSLTKYPIATIVSIVAALFSALLLTYPSVFIGNATDELLLSISLGIGLTSEFVFFIWLSVAFALGYFVTALITGYLFGYIVLSWERDARQEFFETLQEFSMAFHDQYDSKRLLSIAMQDIRWVRMSMNPAFRQLLSALGSIIITTIILFSFDPFFGILMGIGIPLFLVLSYRYANRVEPIRRTRSETMEQLTGLTQEAFRGIEVVRSFGREKTELEKFDAVALKYASANRRESQLAAFYLPALIISLMTGIAFLYGSLQVSAGVFTVGRLIQILILLIVLDSWNFSLPRFLLIIRGGHVNSKRIIKLLNWTEPLADPDRDPSKLDFSNNITFENVSFSYDKQSPVNYVIQDLSMSIPNGSRVALIGGPGSGKTTILKLLLRLYDPDKGRILIGDTELTTVNTKDIRERIGLVEQDIFLFRMSIADNIAFGCKEHCTRDKIIEAAKKAQADEFIQAMPEGYDTIIGERGMTLSGGQRQRLAIARSIIQDPKLLLLDDSVSAIDAKTEYYLRQALDEVMTARTSITITQRLRTLLESDLILIMDRGKLIAIGNHKELIKSSSHYRRIFKFLPGAASYLDHKQNGGKE